MALLPVLDPPGTLAERESRLRREIVAVYETVGTGLLQSDLTPQENAKRLRHMATLLGELAIVRQSLENA